MHQVVTILFYAWIAVTVGLLVTMMLSFPLLLVVLRIGKPNYYQKIGAPSPLLYTPYGIPLDRAAATFRKTLDKGIPAGFPKGKGYRLLAQVYRRSSLFGIVSLVILFPVVVIAFLTGFPN